VTSIQRQLAVGASHLFQRKRNPPVGARPGTLALPADSPPPRIQLMRYDADHLEERAVESVDELAELLQKNGKETKGVCWIDVQGYGDGTAIERLREIFELHPLAMADAVNAPQRPKAELYDNFYLYLTRMVRLGEHREICAEQVCFFLGKTYVLTLQEQYGDVFDPVRKRIRQSEGMIRRHGADYLTYSLIDAVLDGYYPVIELLGDRLHELEEEILVRPSPAGMRRIHAIRHELLGLRRAIWPQREAVNALIREESDLVSHVVRQYLRDCYDHAVQTSDAVETFRDLAANLMDLYLSSVSQRTNEVMKVLTIMASIFIPLTFIVGVYGMNFDYMPELHVWWAYPVLLIVMALIAVGMIVFFRMKGWIGRSSK
jgi:magnesium transporter